MWVLCFPHYKCWKSLSNHESKTSDLEGLFWHEWCGKLNNHISDLTVFTLLKKTLLKMWKNCKMVSKPQYSPLYNYKVVSIALYSLLTLVLRLKVFFNNDHYHAIEPLLPVLVKNLQQFHGFFEYLQKSCQITVSNSKLLYGMKWVS